MKNIMNNIVMELKISSSGPEHESLVLITNELKHLIHIDYYTGFLIPALISARVDRISQSPKGKGLYGPRAEIRAGIKKNV